MTSAISVKDRLKRQATASGKTMQDALTAYGLERTVYRLSVSEYSERFTLKGGIFLYALFDGEFARATGDIDLLARNLPKDVVSSVMSGNIPTVINFRTKDASELTTSVIRKDSANLLGRGDFLLSRPHAETAQRFQGAFIDLEVSEIVSSLKKKD